MLSQFRSNFGNKVDEETLKSFNPSVVITLITWGVCVKVNIFMEHCCPVNKLPELSLPCNYQGLDHVPTTAVDSWLNCK